MWSQAAGTMADNCTPNRIYHQERSLSVTAYHVLQKPQTYSSQWSQLQGLSHLAKDYVCGFIQGN